MGLSLYIKFYDGWDILHEKYGKKILIVPILVILIGLILLFSVPGISAAWNQAQIQRLPNTDLTGIRLDDITLNGSDKVMESTYTISEKYDLKGYSDGYEELVVLIEDHKVKKICADMQHVTLSIDNSSVQSVYAVKNILGNHYYDRLYDNEQSYHAATYLDRMHGIKATFVYELNTGRIDHTYLGGIHDKF